MTDLVTRLNESKFLTAERVGGRIKVKLAVTIPKEIYSRFDYKSHIKKGDLALFKVGGFAEIGDTHS